MGRYRSWGLTLPWLHRHLPHHLLLQLLDHQWQYEADHSALVHAIDRHVTDRCRRLPCQICNVVRRFRCILSEHINGLQHKGAMSTKPVFEKITKIQKSYVPLCGHMAFVLLIPKCTVVKITTFYNDINKMNTSVKLLAINILCYVS